MPAFPPIVGSALGTPPTVPPKILVLGSMPGRVSLEHQQYYAFSHNAFWWIMAELLQFDLSAHYHQRVQALIDSGLAVWDVLKDCERPGSLDGDIVRTSEQPNDFAAFFKRYPSIELIAFNGGAAKTIFMRHCRDLFDDLPELEWVQLPSTSPAYASMRRDTKLEQWRTTLADKLPV